MTLSLCQQFTYRYKISSKNWKSNVIFWNKCLLNVLSFRIKTRANRKNTTTTTTIVVRRHKNFVFRRNIIRYRNVNNINICHIRRAWFINFHFRFIFRDNLCKIWIITSNNVNRHWQHNQFNCFFFFKKLIIIASTTKIIVDFDNRNFYRNQKNDRQIQNDNRNRDDYNDKKKYRQIYQSKYRQIYQSRYRQIY